MKIPFTYNISELSNLPELEKLNGRRQELVDDFAYEAAMAREQVAKRLLDAGLLPSDYNLHEKIETVDCIMTYTCWPVKKEK